MVVDYITQRTPEEKAAPELLAACKAAEPESASSAPTPIRVYCFETRQARRRLSHLLSDPND